MLYLLASSSASADIALMQYEEAKTIENYKKEEKKSSVYQSNELPEQISIYEKRKKITRNWNEKQNNRMSKETKLTNKNLSSNIPATKKCEKSMMDVSMKGSIVCCERSNLNYYRYYGNIQADAALMKSKIERLFEESSSFLQHFQSFDKYLNENAFIHTILEFENMINENIDPFHLNHTNDGKSPALNNLKSLTLNYENGNRRRDVETKHSFRLRNSSNYDQKNVVKTRHSLKVNNNNNHKRILPLFNLFNENFEKNNQLNCKDCDRRQSCRSKLITLLRNNSYSSSSSIKHHQSNILPVRSNERKRISKESSIENINNNNNNNNNNRLLSSIISPLSDNDHLTKIEEESGNPWILSAILLRDSSKNVDPYGNLLKKKFLTNSFIHSTIEKCKGHMRRCLEEIDVNQFEMKLLNRLNEIENDMNDFGIKYGIEKQMNGNSIDVNESTALNILDRLNNRVKECRLLAKHLHQLKHNLIIASNKHIHQLHHLENYHKLCERANHLLDWFNDNGTYAVNSHFRSVLMTLSSVINVKEDKSDSMQSALLSAHQNYEKFFNRVEEKLRKAKEIKNEMEFLFDSIFNNQSQMDLMATSCTSLLTLVGVTASGNDEMKIEKQFLPNDNENDDEFMYDTVDELNSEWMETSSIEMKTIKKNEVKRLPTNKVLLLQIMKKLEKRLMKTDDYSFNLQTLSSLFESLPKFNDLLKLIMKCNGDVMNCLVEMNIVNEENVEKNSKELNHILHFYMKQLSQNDCDDFHKTIENALSRLDDYMKLISNYLYEFTEHRSQMIEDNLLEEDNDWNSTFDHDMPRMSETNEKILKFKSTDMDHVRITTQLVSVLHSLKSQCMETLHSVKLRKLILKRLISTNSLNELMNNKNSKKIIKIREISKLHERHKSMSMFSASEMHKSQRKKCSSLNDLNMEMEKRRELSEKMINQWRLMRDNSSMTETNESSTSCYQTDFTTSSIHSADTSIEEAFKDLNQIDMTNNMTTSNQSPSMAMTCSNISSEMPYNFIDDILLPNKEMKKKMIEQISNQNGTTKTISSEMSIPYSTSINYNNNDYDYDYDYSVPLEWNGINDNIIPPPLPIIPSISLSSLVISSKPSSPLLTTTSTTLEGGGGGGGRRNPSNQSDRHSVLLPINQKETQNYHNDSLQSSKFTNFHQQQHIQHSTNNFSTISNDSLDVYSKLIDNGILEGNSTESIHSFLPSSSSPTYHSTSDIITTNSHILTHPTPTHTNTPTLTSFSSNLTANDLSTELYHADNEHDDSDVDDAFDMDISGPCPHQTTSGVTVHRSISQLHECKQRKKSNLLHRFQELLSTEISYCNSLKYVIENYMNEFNEHAIIDLSRANSRNQTETIKFPSNTSRNDQFPKLLIGKRNILFGNIEYLYDFHFNKLLPDIRQCRHQPLRIGEVFLRYKHQFQSYAYYYKNKPASDELLQECRSYFDEKQCELEDRLNLDSYLLKPVQRLGKYYLILKQIYNEINIDSDSTDNDQSLMDFFSNTDLIERNRFNINRNGNEPLKAIEIKYSLKSAVSFMQYCLRLGDNLLAIDKIRGCPFDLSKYGNLLIHDRCYVQTSLQQTTKRYSRLNNSTINHESTTSIVQALSNSRLRLNKFSLTNKFHVRQIFLFEKILIFTKIEQKDTEADSFVYRDAILTDQLGLTEQLFAGNSNQFQLWNYSTIPRFSNSTNTTNTNSYDHHSISNSNKFRRKNPMKYETYTIQVQTENIRKKWTHELSRLLWKQAIENKEKRLVENLSMGLTTDLRKYSIQNSSTIVNDDFNTFINTTYPFDSLHDTFDQPSSNRNDKEVIDTNPLSLPSSPTNTPKELTSNEEKNNPKISSPLPITTSTSYLPPAPQTKHLTNHRTQWQRRSDSNHISDKKLLAHRTHFDTTRTSTLSSNESGIIIDCRSNSLHLSSNDGKEEKRISKNFDQRLSDDQLLHHNSTITIHNRNNNNNNIFHNYHEMKNNSAIYTEL
ncbi:hypothetical protein SNEBB_005947 [Seison nebaliae]|nr:hypothetical protein SNEBB_005947 [Seison nebaliae]